MDTENIARRVQLYVIIYSIKRCAQIEKSRDRNLVGIIAGQKIVKDTKQGCLSVLCRDRHVGSQRWHAYDGDFKRELA